MYTKTYIKDKFEVTEYYESWYDILADCLILGFYHIIAGLCILIFAPLLLTIGHDRKWYKILLETYFIGSSYLLTGLIGFSLMPFIVLYYILNPICIRSSGKK